MSFKETILKFFGEIGAYLAAVLKPALQAELKVVLPLAAKAVAQVAADPTLLSGGAKRDAAVAAILAQLAKAQVSIGISTVNLAIELAVQKSKAMDEAAS